MKTHYVVLTCLSLLLFACPSSDDDNQEEALFTPTNYIYERDIRLFYLETENLRLTNDIAIWNQVSPNDPGYDDAQGNIAEATVEIAQNQADSTDLADNFSLSALEVGFVIPSNFPPLPDPCLCLSTRNSITKILLLPGTSSSNVSVLRDNENILDSNPTINDVPGVDVDLKYQTINFSDLDFEGEAIFTLETNGNAPISVDAYIFNL